MTGGSARERRSVLPQLHCNGTLLISVKLEVVSLSPIRLRGDSALEEEQRERTVLLMCE